MLQVQNNPYICDVFNLKIRKNMKTIVIYNQVELAEFINTKAINGFTELRVAHGAYTSPLRAEDFIKNQEIKFPVTVEYAECGECLIIGDLM